MWTQLESRVAPMSRDRSAANLHEKCRFVTNKGEVVARFSDVIFIFRNRIADQPSKMRDFTNNFWYPLDKSIQRQFCAKSELNFGNFFLFCEH